MYGLFLICSCHWKQRRIKNKEELNIFRISTTMQHAYSVPVHHLYFSTVQGNLKHYQWITISLRGNQENIDHRQWVLWHSLHIACSETTQYTQEGSISWRLHFMAHNSLLAARSEAQTAVTHFCTTGDPFLSVTTPNIHHVFLNCATSMQPYTPLVHSDLLDMLLALISLLGYLSNSKSHMVISKIDFPHKVYIIQLHLLSFHSVARSKPFQVLGEGTKAFGVR